MGYRPCVCCGIGTISSEENSFDICPICGWEDDGVQEHDPDYAGGANELSLNDYRKKFQEVRKKDPDYMWVNDPEKMREK